MIANYQPSLLERLLATLLPEVGRWIDPSVKKSFSSYQQWDGEVRNVDTILGARSITGLLEGVGRVTDVFSHSDGSVEVTVAHGKFASVLADGSVEHDWLPCLDGHAPLIHGPSARVVQAFIDASFTIRLLPLFKNGRRVVPTLKRAALVKYQFLTTDDAGREGVAIGIEPA